MFVYVCIVYSPLITTKQSAISKIRDSEHWELEFDWLSFTEVARDNLPLLHSVLNYPFCFLSGENFLRKLW